MSPTLLVVAKAPVPGLAKTRIGNERGHDVAADLAAASLLDTLDTALTVGWPVTVAMTGDLDEAARRTELRAALARCTVVAQRGDGFAERLVNAHLDSDVGKGVVQVGMDTPHVTMDDYVAAGRALSRGANVIGPASDGGWWLLGVREAEQAAPLAHIEMSRPDTGQRTIEAIGEPLERLRELRDLDTWSDAVAVAAELPGSRLAETVAAASR